MWDVTFSLQLEVNGMEAFYFWLAQNHTSLYADQGKNVMFVA